MPELPEVETIVRGLAPRLVGRPLRRPTLYKTDVLRGITPRRFLDAVRNQHIQSVSRRAKHIVIELDPDRRIIIQLRMTGNLLWHEGRLRGRALDYVVFRAGLDPGESLLYRDVRRLGTISLLDQAQWRSYTDRLGPEPLDPDFDLDRFADRLGRTRQAIKKAIMDQRILAGVGNIYANEALFRARIDPSRPANQVGAAELGDLMHHVQIILSAAIRAGGTTLRDYRTADDQPGSFQRSLDVYGRAGEGCVACGTTLVDTHEIDGRQTVLCWRCQR